MSNIGFTLTKNGYWPEETYSFSPITTIFPANLGFIKFLNLNFYSRNPTIWLEWYNTYFWPFKGQFKTNLTAQEIADGYPLIDYSASDSALVFVTSAARLQNSYANLVNYFILQNTSTATPEFYGYLFFPQNLILKPIQASRISSSQYTLQLKASLSQEDILFFKHEDPMNFENVPTLYQNYMDQSNLNITDYPTSNNNLCTFFYGISSTQSISRKNVINFTNAFNPATYAVLLNTTGYHSKIKKDRTFTEFTLDYDDYQDFRKIQTLDNPHPDSFQTNKPLSVPINYTFDEATSTQTFLLLQSSLNVGYTIQSIQNAVVYTKLDLNTTRLEYDVETRNIGSTLYKVASGKSGTSLNLSYLIDSSYIESTGERVQDTVLAYNVQGSPSATLNNGGVASNISNNNTITFTTKYPPHYYSYQLSVSSKSVTNKTVEHASTFFQLTSYPHLDTGTSILIHTVLQTENKMMTLELETYGEHDQIMYVPDFTESSLINQIEQVFVGTKTSRTTPYDLKNPTWVPAHQNTVLEIVYPDYLLGSSNIKIRPYLKTKTGLNQAQKTSTFQLKGKYDNQVYPLYYEILKEDIDYIDIDISMLNDVNGFTGLDFTNSNISWIYETIDPNIKLYTLTKNLDGTYTRTNSVIQSRSTIPYNQNSWYVRLEGYGPNTTLLTLSSQKYNNTVTLSSDPSFFDYFNEQKLIVEPVGTFDNSPETRTVVLSAYIPFKGRKYSIKSDSPIFWSWNYNDTYNSLTTPITANYTKYNNNIYTYRENDFADKNDKLKFTIKPPKTNIANNVELVFTAHTADTIIPYTGSYKISADTFPNTNLLNADFDIAYQSFPDEKILETRKNQYTLTRPNNSNAKYLIKANTDILPNITYTSLKWEIVNAANQKTTYNNILSFNLDATTSSKFTVTLFIIDALVTGWTNRHTVTQTATIYSLPQTDFDKQLNFIVYPEYTWKNSDKLTLLNDSNYTLSVGPTAYRYKKSNDQNFKVLADTGFNKYVYSLNENGINLGSFDTPSGIITIPDTLAYQSSQGQSIILSAYNEYFPEGMSLYYKTIESGILVEKTYNNVTKTIPYSISTPTINLFKQNPKGVDYNDIGLTFNPLIYTYDLDVNRIIRVNQNLYNIPTNTPTKVVENTSTITYILSAPKWFVKKEIPATNGTFTLFTLNVGDDLTELTVDGTKQSTLKLSASANLNIKIPSTTFDNYDLIQWPSNRDLWDIKNINVNTNYGSTWNTLVAYSTSVEPKIVLSTYYATTGSEIYVEFDTPDYPTNKIKSYVVDFGGGNYVSGLPSEKFYHTYNNFGTYYITYSAIYQDNSYKKYIEKIPFVIQKEWPEYSQEKIRIISETQLELPYSKEEIEIQPNEFGDSDIFNTSLKRSLECLQFLKNNTQTINTDSPVVFYGWMGTSNVNKSSGIRWYTETSYGSDFYTTPNYALPTGQNTDYPSDKFDNIKDIYVGKKYIYVLDDKKFRLFDIGKDSKEVKFLNANEQDGLFFDPSSIVINDDETSIYVADSIRHKVYRFDFDFSDVFNPIFTLVLNVGTLGSLNDSSKFDFPTDLHLYDENLFVLDYNNNCIKQYSKDLSWIYTYYDNLFEGKQIVNFAIHPTGLIYVLLNDSTIYIFDQNSEKTFSSFTVNNINTEEIKKIIFDEVGEFLLFISKTNILKYSASGEYISTYSLPDINGLEFTSAIASENRSINVSTNYSILRFQDFVQLFKIGGDSGKAYWSDDQILLKKSEFAQDLNYNVALTRIAQNIKTFRDSLNAKFVLVSEQTVKGRVTYFSIVPITKDEKITLDSDVENENLLIGTNEFYIPSVVNREISKIYNSILQLKTYLDVSSVATNKAGNITDSCLGEFCWSWKAMSCYDLSLPAIRVCNINPITYSELVKTFPVNYSPTKSWNDAVSNCCNENASPLD